MLNSNSFKLFYSLTAPNHDDKLNNIFIYDVMVNNILSLKNIPFNREHLALNVNGLVFNAGVREALVFQKHICYNFLNIISNFA